MSLDSLFDQKLVTYEALLQKWGRVINLVAPSTLAEARIRHFEDSLQILPFLPSSCRTLFDLGSGAGFPGLVIALARQDVTVHLIESDQKKCSFLSTVSRETVIPVIIHTQRIESVDIPTVPDVITARALAPLVDLLKMCRRWIVQNPDLLLIFPKGARFQEEIDMARKTFYFDAEMVQSNTDGDAKILVLKNVAPLI